LKRSALIRNGRLKTTCTSDKPLARGELVECLDGASPPTFGDRSYGLAPRSAGSRRCGTTTARMTLMT
jgi:hypothetical protein